MDGSLHTIPIIYLKEGFKKPEVGHDGHLNSIYESYILLPHHSGNSATAIKFYLMQFLCTKIVVVYQ